MSSKLLSIIIPTYNVERYLHKCLSSLIVSSPQLLDALEVLVVIDGSKDRSAEIAKEYQKEYPNVFSVIEKENGNYGSCINAALPLTTGKYVKILDADDYFDTEKFESYLNEIQSLDVDMILNNMTIVDSQYEVTGSWDMHLREREHIPFSEFAGHYWDFFIHKFAYRRTLLNEIGYTQTEGISYTDNEWVAKPMVVVNTMYFIPNAFYCYLRGREDQTISKASKSRSFSSLTKMMLSLGRIWSEYQGEALRKECLYNLLYKQLSYAYHEFFILHYYPYSQFRAFDRKITSLYPIIKEEKRLKINYRSFSITSFWQKDIPVITPIILYLHAKQSALRARFRG